MFAVGGREVLIEDHGVCGAPSNPSSCENLSATGASLCRLRKRFRGVSFCASEQCKCWRQKTERAEEDVVMFV